MASGVDPTMVQFVQVPVKTPGDGGWGQTWIKSMVWSQHTHDVRSVVYVGENCVVSAGQSPKKMFEDIIFCGIFFSK